MQQLSSIVLAVLSLTVGHLYAIPSICFYDNDNRLICPEDFGSSEELVTGPFTEVGYGEGEDSDQSEAFQRALRASDRGHNFMRFGRDPEHKFMRFGREPAHKFMRFGREKSAGHNFMRFGRERPQKFARQSRGPQHNILRFGRSVDTVSSPGSKTTSNGDALLRRGRQPEHKFMRFGRTFPMATAYDDLSQMPATSGEKNSEVESNEKWNVAQIRRK